MSEPPPTGIPSVRADITFLRSNYLMDLNLREFRRRFYKSLDQSRQNLSFIDLPATTENFAIALHSKVMQIACHGE